jgi:hypothetical protein
MQNRFRPPRYCAAVFRHRTRGQRISSLSILPTLASVWLAKAAGHSLPAAFESDDPVPEVLLGEVGRCRWERHGGVTVRSASWRGIENVAVGHGRRFDDRAKLAGRGGRKRRDGTSSCWLAQPRPAAAPLHERSFDRRGASSGRDRGAHIERPRYLCEAA